MNEERFEEISEKARQTGTQFWKTVTFHGLYYEAILEVLESNGLILGEILLELNEIYNAKKDKGETKRAKGRPAKK